MAGPWTTVRVFISSTFRDMHAERDHLVKVVFPVLREELERHRVHLVDIDLRWGVTKDQADNDQSVGVCLGQIDACRPFFLGVIGERYGWVPTRFPADAIRKYDWVQHHAGKSVTELEILHGGPQRPAATGAELARVGEGDVWGVCLSPDGSRLAAPSWDQTVRVWDMTTGAEVVHLPVHSLGVT